MRNLKVVDFTYGKRDSEDVNTSLPFTDNFKECRTIQQANVVLGAYVNANYKDNFKNKQLIDDNTSDIEEIKQELIDIEQSKQDTLVSGENIKTINNESILGTGNIEISAKANWGNISGNILDQEDLVMELNNVAGMIPTKTSDLTNDSNFITDSYHDSTKQDNLISGTNIKTINNDSILGSGNIETIVNTESTDTNKSYSCDYMNNSYSNIDLLYDNSNGLTIGQSATLLKNSDDYKIFYVRFGNGQGESVTGVSVNANKSTNNNGMMCMATVGYYASIKVAFNGTTITTAQWQIAGWNWNNIKVYQVYASK